MAKVKTPRKKYKKPEPIEPNSICHFCFGDGPLTKMVHKKLKVILGYEIVTGKVKLRLSKSHILSLVKTKPANEIPYTSQVCEECKPRAIKAGFQVLTNSTKRAKVA